LKLNNIEKGSAMLDVVALSIVLIVFAALINYLRPNKSSGAKQRDNAPINRYHAVAIAKNPAACLVSAQLIGKRFLSNDAPTLPMLGCDARPCRCRYQHYADRRRGDDRRFPFGVRKSSEPHVANIERRRNDRRKSVDLLFT
jgi:hypothetical protein